MTPTSLITAKARNESPERVRGAIAAAPSRIPARLPGVTAAGPQRASQGLKQALDFLGAAVLLLLTTPLFLLVAALIKLNSPGPVFYVQKRVGRGGRVFACYKFRTMQHNSDEGPHREFARAFIRGANGGSAAEATPLPAGDNGHGNGNGNGKGHARIY